GGNQCAQVGRQGLARRSRRKRSRTPSHDPTSVQHVRLHSIRPDGKDGRPARGETRTGTTDLKSTKLRHRRWQGALLPDQDLPRYTQERRGTDEEISQLRRSAPHSVRCAEVTVAER